VTRRRRPRPERGTRRWRGGSFRRALRAEALRRAELPRPAAPVADRMRYRPYLPGAAPGSQDQAVSLARVAPSPGRSRSGGGTPRIVRAAPSTRKGTRRSFLTAAQKGSSGPTLARGASGDPAGLTARARPEARPQRRAANLTLIHVKRLSTVIRQGGAGRTACHTRARTGAALPTASCHRIKCILSNPSRHVSMEIGAISTVRRGNYGERSAARCPGDAR
jgi:hypothetical protein